VATDREFETGEERRRRQRNEALGLEMLSRLETQGREILEKTEALAREDGGQTFSSYRAFRTKLGEFESFCNVIETQLGRIAGERRGDLDDLFRKRRAMIFRPAIAALTAFFQRMADGRGALPFGLSNVIDNELTAIADIRDIVNAPNAFSAEDAAAINAEIDRLETTIKSLDGKATGFEDFAPAPQHDAEG
jgi:hypothetical protein